MQLDEMIRGASAELRRLSAAPDELDAVAARRRLEGFFVPALEAEDPNVAKATRATMRWLINLRAERGRGPVRALPRATPLAAAL